MNEKTIERDDFLKNVLYILRETFEGSPAGEPSAYLDRGVGIFATLDKINAADASRFQGETTVAAHTEHAKFYLDRICALMHGKNEKINWEQSWLIETVSDEEWNHLRAGMRCSYENVLRCFAEIETWNDRNIGESIAIIAHTAYHLGAIRQIMKTETEHG